MEKEKQYAIITGDVVDSSLVKGKDKNRLHEVLKQAFDTIKKKIQTQHEVSSFTIFRGDSFQGVLYDISKALEAGIFIRASLRKNQPEKQQAPWDARIAIGIDTIDYLPANVSEGDGPAYRSSGVILDELRGDHKFAITGPNPKINDEFKASCALLDAVINKWTPAQAEIICMLLQDMNQKEIGQDLGISQAAVHYRVKGAEWFAIKELLARYKAIMQAY